MGTPNEQIWPGVSQLPDYKETFPQWTRQDLRNIVPNLDEMGIDLLSVSGWFFGVLQRPHSCMSLANTDL